MGPFDFTWQQEYHSVLTGLQSYVSSWLIRPCATTRLIVVDVDRAYTCFKYGAGPTSLVLLYRDGHYDAITYLRGFFGRSSFCGTCFKGVNNMEHHHCNDDASLCRKCFPEGCPDHTQFTVMPGIDGSKAQGGSPIIAP